MKTTDKRSFGDIALADITFTDRSGSKLRPVLVVYTAGEDVTILKITSQKRSGNILNIPMDATNKLRKDSTLLLPMISTYHKTLLHTKIGSINPTQKELIKTYRSQFPLKR